MFVCDKNPVPSPVLPPIPGSPFDATAIVKLPNGPPVVDIAPLQPLLPFVKVISASVKEVPVAPALPPRLSPVLPTTLNDVTGVLSVVIVVEPYPLCFDEFSKRACIVYDVLALNPVKVLL